MILVNIWLPHANINLLTGNIFYRHNIFWNSYKKNEKGNCSQIVYPYSKHCITYGSYDRCRLLDSNKKTEVTAGWTFNIILGAMNKGKAWWDTVPCYVNRQDLMSDQSQINLIWSVVQSGSQLCQYKDGTVVVMKLEGHLVAGLGDK